MISLQYVAVVVVGEVGDELHEAEHEDDEAGEHRRADGGDEEPVVDAAHAVVQPATVMIEVADALVALRAVLVANTAAATSQQLRHTFM